MRSERNFRGQTGAAGTGTPGGGENRPENPQDQSPDRGRPQPAPALAALPADRRTAVPVDNRTDLKGGPKC